MKIVHVHSYSSGQRAINIRFRQAGYDLSLSLTLSQALKVGAKKGTVQSLTCYTPEYEYVYVCSLSNS